MTYREYLQSPAWRQLAEQARARAHHRCEHCLGPPDHVHHVRYPANRDYSADCLENLLVVCASCHAKHHGIRGHEMNNAETIDFEGIALCVTYEDGIVWVEFSEVARALAMVNLRWCETHKRELVEGEDWKLMTNPFTGTVTPWLSESGVLIAGMRFGGNDRARKLRKQLARMATSKRTPGTEIAPVQAAGSFLSVGASLVAQANAIWDLEKQIAAQDARIDREIEAREAMQANMDKRFDDMREKVEEYARCADWMRNTGKDGNEAEFGKFLANLAKARGGRRTQEGWFDAKGHQLSRSLPAPDTRFHQINKWRVSYMAWAWPQFERLKNEENEKSDG